MASGCTDRTAEIAREFSAREPRVKLIIEECRAGKASAINIFLQNATNGICVLQGADTLPRPDTTEKLVAPFADARALGGPLRGAVPGLRGGPEGLQELPRLAAAARADEDGLHGLVGAARQAHGGEGERHLGIGCGERE